MRQLGRESGGLSAGAGVLGTSQGALEDGASHQGHQSQRCRAAPHPTAALGVIRAQVGVAAGFGLLVPYPIVGDTFLLTVPGHSDVAKKGITWERKIGEEEEVREGKKHGRNMGLRNTDRGGVEQP